MRRAAIVVEAKAATCLHNAGHSNKTELSLAISLLAELVLAVRLLMVLSSKFGSAVETSSRSCVLARARYLQCPLRSLRRNSLAMGRAKHGLCIRRLDSGHSSTPDCGLSRQFIFVSSADMKMRWFCSRSHGKIASGILKCNAKSIIGPYTPRFVDNVDT